MIRRPAPRKAADPGARTVSDEPLQGVCEMPGCGGRARADCGDCEGEYCLKHLPHASHAAAG